MTILSGTTIKRNIKIFILFLIVALLLDQVSKIFVISILNPFDPPRDIIGSIIRFKLAFNPYGVFSIQFGPKFLYYVLNIVGITAFTFIGLSQETKVGAAVWALIIGGALGNFLDRLRMKYVIDFIDMGFGNYRWYVYNLADAFITVGIVTLIARELFSKKPGPVKIPEATPPEPKP
jgi:signal peptidase II